MNVDARGLRVVGRLVTRALANQMFLVDAVYLYMVKNERLRDVADRIGISVHWIRHEVYTIISLAGSYVYAARVVEMVYDKVRKIEPIVDPLDTDTRFKWVNAVCRICNEHLSYASARAHIDRRHRDIVATHVARIVMAL